MLEQIKRLAAPATALLASMAMFGPSDDAEAYRSPSQTPTEDGVAALNLRFNPGTGKTVCDAEMHSDYQEYTHGPITMTRVEQWDKKAKEWSVNPLFRQPFEEGPQQEDAHISKTTLTTIYNTKRLRRADAYAPARITCYGGGNDVALQVTFKHPLKKNKR